ncbi:hypothetical protein ACFL9T_16485 [Thermodesulfobacteriota bacterium]
MVLADDPAKTEGLFPVQFSKGNAGAATAGALKTGAEGRIEELVQIAGMRLHSASALNAG